MSRHAAFHINIRELRSKGLTYPEINSKLGTDIPKSTLSYICKGIVLNPAQTDRVNNIMATKMIVNRQKAIVANKKIFDEKLEEYKRQNQNIKPLMEDRRAKLITLATLYLGEGAKWRSRRGLMLGSADPKILKLYINLLEDCYGITTDKIRCRIQHRADQDPDSLIKYWSRITGVKQKHFYPCYADKRTIGKPTLKTDYRGVCVATCAGTHVQLELQIIADIIEETMGI